MRKEYQHHAQTIVTADHDKKVYGERVKPGWILKVLTCFLHLPDSDVSDIAEVLIDRGSGELEIRARAGGAGSRGLSTLAPFYVGEYQRVIGHAPDSIIDDELGLTVIGELIPLNKWRKGKV